jgi:hypothetical protein
MVNIQQPEMRRNEQNPTVQDSKEPRPGEPARIKGGKGGGARPVPPEQVSPYGPAQRPVADASHRSEERGD